MLSRIARGLYEMGSDIERAQNVVRVLEVTHKMSLLRDPLHGSEAWIAVCQAFEVEDPEPGPVPARAHLVESPTHPFSVTRCLGAARERARALREVISEELWEHVNRYYLELAEAPRETLRALDPVEFNRQVETFCDAFHGLATDTMIHGPEWHFLRLGRFFERARMLGRILEIKSKRLSLVPGEEGRPIDFHQWQGMLRSLSAYEPYRRTFDARIDPSRAISFVVRDARFARSLAHCLGQISDSLGAVACGVPAQVALQAAVEEYRHEVSATSAELLLATGLEDLVRQLRARLGVLSRGFEDAYFHSLRPIPGRAYVAQAARGSQ